jgi:3-phenylpropionate/trans-cinnamate dioxygenase ferredoxin reductase component
MSLKDPRVSALELAEPPRAEAEARPYFFSDQYDVGMEYSGLARGCDRVVVRGDPAAREFIAFWLFEDRVMAGMNVNVWDVTDPIKQLIQERVAVNDRDLADPDVPLDRLAHATSGRTA